MRTILRSLARMIRRSLRAVLLSACRPSHLVASTSTRTPEAVPANAMPVSCGAHATATAGADTPAMPLDKPWSNDFLLAARLAGVARLNGPAARAGNHTARTTAVNRPVVKPAEPVKSSQPAAWILARRISPDRTARPATAKIIELRSVRPQRGTRRRAALPLAA